MGRRVTCISRKQKREVPVNCGKRRVRASNISYGSLAVVIGWKVWRIDEIQGLQNVPSGSQHASCSSKHVWRCLLTSQVHHPEEEGGRPSTGHSSLAPWAHRLMRCSGGCQRGSASLRLISRRQLLGVGDEQHLMSRQPADLPWHIASQPHTQRKVSALQLRGPDHDRSLHCVATATIRMLSPVPWGLSRAGCANCCQLAGTPR